MAVRRGPSLRSLVAVLALIASPLLAADIDALWDYTQPAVSEARFRDDLKPSLVTMRWSLKHRLPAPSACVVNSHRRTRCSTPCSGA